ncbi:MAG: FecR domain-containing protein [Lachnospiraceae bacterium]|nr:FecR domain-containing protein [Lachnospiraceae bacterium]
MKKKTGIIIGVVSAVVLIGGIIAAVSLLNKGDSYRVIKVMETEGYSYVKRENAGELDTYEGMTLQSGDAIHVDSNSSLILMMDDDKVAYVEANTDLVLYATGNERNSKTGIDLLNGAITCEVRKKLNSNSTYEINTPNSTMAVRGTTVRAEVISYPVDLENSVSIDEAIKTCGANELCAQFDPAVRFAPKEVRKTKLILTRLSTLEGRAVAGTHSNAQYDLNGKSLMDYETDISEGNEIYIASNDLGAKRITDAVAINLKTFPKQAISNMLRILEESGKMIFGKKELSELEDEKNEGPFTVYYIYNDTLFSVQENVTKGSKIAVPSLTPEKEGKWDVDFENSTVESDVYVKWISK